MKTNIWDNKELIKILKEDGVAVMPTDTIYGIIGRAQSEPAVNRIYKVRNRTDNKPCIILIGSLGELEKFPIILSENQKNKLKEYWPGPVSVVLECPNEKLFYLHRGTNTLAFRMPAPEGLRDLLLKAGPLIAPSANTEKFPVSENIQDAQKYFSNKVNFYLDGGPIISKASKVIKLNKDGTVDILRF